MESHDKEVEAMCARAVTRIKDFLHARQSERMNRVKTLTYYNDFLRLTSERFCTLFRRDFETMTRDDLKIMVDQMLAKGYRNATIAAVTMSCNVFFKWLIETEQRTEQNPYDSKYMSRFIGKQARSLDVLPPVGDFFKVRRHTTMLRDALLLEIAISSGMRMSEMLATPVKNYDLTKIPIDETTGQPSVYAGGTVFIDASLIEVKNGTSRKTFISVLAARLLRLWCKVHNLPLDSDLRLFPYTQTTMSMSITHLVARVFGKSKFEETVVRTRKLRRTVDDYTMKNIDVDESVSEDYRISFEKMKRSLQRDVTELGVIDTTVAGSYIEKARDNIRTHMMRNLFSVAMYRRTYQGMERDIRAVQSLLGHASLDQTEGYLRVTNDYVLPMRDWRKIMLGDGTEHRNVFIKYSHLMEDL